MLRYGNQIKGSIIYIDMEGNKHKVNMYNANCLGAFIHKYKDENNKEQHQLLLFFNDTIHLKNMLGLTKEYKDNLLKKSIYKIRLNTYFNDNIKIATLFAQAKIKTELYYKDMKCNKNL